MFKVGDKIKVIDAPYLRHPGKKGTIISILDEDGRAFADIETNVGIISVYLEFLELIGPRNKWNPLNYKSHFEPLKLP